MGVGMSFRSIPRQSSQPRASIAMKAPLVCAALLAATLSACSYVAISPSANEAGLFSIAGRIRFKKDVVVPPNARVLVVWSVSSGSPDYLYVYGEGTIRMADSTFKVVFD